MWKNLFCKKMCWKTVNVMNLIPENIVWVDTLLQPLYDELQKKKKKIKFIHGLPDSFEVNTLFPPETSDYSR